MKHSRTTLFVAAYISGLLSLAAVGYWYADFRVTMEHQQALHANEKFQTDVAYIDLPPMNITLTSSGVNVTGRLRMNISLEVDKKYAVRIEDYAPRITDRIVDYTQGLDADQLGRPAAPNWLKERFLRIANSSSNAPAPVIDIVFRQFLVM